MNDVTISRHQSRPHYAKVIALVGTLWVAASLCLPLINGPFGMQVSGWQLLGEQALLMAGVLLVAAMVSMVGMYRVCALIAAGIVLAMVSKVQGVNAALAANQLAQDDPMAQAMVAMATTQVGLAWGVPMLMLGILAMLTCGVFYRP